MCIYMYIYTYGFEGVTSTILIMALMHALLPDSAAPTTSAPLRASTV